MKNCRELGKELSGLKDKICKILKDQNFDANEKNNQIYNLVR